MPPALQKYSRYNKEEFFPIGVTITSGAAKGSDKKKHRGIEEPQTAPGNWSIEEAFQPRAMVLARDKLYLAGWLDSFPIELKSGRPKNPAVPDAHDAVLRVYAASDGKRLAEFKLAGDPVWDGIAAAYGSLFVSQQDGKIICLSE